MKNIPFEIIGATKVITNVRSTYLEFQERLEFNTNRQLHERIYLIYAIELPDLINEIYYLLDMHEWKIRGMDYILFFRSRLDDVHDAKLLQDRYENSEYKSEIESMIDRLSKLVWEAVVTLQTLETTI